MDYVRRMFEPDYGKWSSKFTTMVDQFCGPDYSSSTGAKAKRRGTVKIDGANGENRMGAARRRHTTASSSFYQLAHTLAGLKLLEPYISKRCFSNHKENVECKLDMIRLWKGILKFCVACSNTKDKKVGYTFILMLMQRDEFSLAHLQSKAKLHHHVCFEYQKVMLITLNYIISSLEKPGCFEELVQFSAEALAIMFFRLPLVSSCITDALVMLAENTRKALEVEDFCMPAALAGRGASAEQIEDMTVSERRRHARRSSTVDTGARRVSTGQATHFIISNPDFYLWAEVAQTASARSQAAAASSADGEDDDSACGTAGRVDDSTVREIIKKWFASKGRLGIEFFMTWVVFWVNHVKTTCGSAEIVWSAIPAYNIILEAYVPLLYSGIWWDANLARKHGVAVGSSYVSSFVSYTNVKQTALKLLENEQLVNPLVELTFRCCNAYSTASVESAVDHLHLWLQCSSKVVKEEERAAMAGTPTGNTDCTTDELARRLPDSFEYESFWQWLSVLLKSASFQVLLKTLSFLYNAFNLFHGEHRLRLVGDILQEFFWDLFLHWSSDVRDFFHHLLVFKLTVKDRRYLPFFSDARAMSKYGRADVTWRIMAESEETRRTRHMELLSTPPEYHNEVLLVDLAVVSKADTYVRYCLGAASASDPDAGSAAAASESSARKSDAAGAASVPPEGLVYVAASLRGYSEHLQSYYMAAMEGRLSDCVPVALNHQMMGHF